MREERTRTQRAAKAVDSRAAHPTLTVLCGPMGVGKILRLDKDEIVIGRTQTADLWLDDEGVSRQHAKVLRHNGEFRVRDLRSKNGTFVNGDRVHSERKLIDGDRLQIGGATIVKFSYTDVLEEQLHQKLYQSATTDPLTGVHNRKFFEETLAKEFAFSLRHNVPISLLVLDLDNFKTVNDSFGHPVGDKVLSAIASRLNEAVRREDLLARYGGEEFVVLLRVCPASQARGAAERLRRLIEMSELVVDEHRIRVTVSVGVASMPEATSSDVESFLKAADAQLYEAKRAGKNRVAEVTRVTQPPRR